MDDYSENLDLLFGALSDPTRRGILSRLCQGPASVGELKEPFLMALPNLLKHIRLLENSGLIETQKYGRMRICSLKPDALIPTEKWLEEQHRLMEGRLDRMEAYIETLKTTKAKENPDEQT
ncbi:MAG: transcriptional regulator [Candidatus Lambdaproteobacteria bacterium RIFOXYD1_FULL_56_27]|uniref:Transcriptional regulator n=1 Tax=Candidatus Lambdaproteobacteria bacterium RIFOXYD2_FULL_56_26 TaxID=1817773 RepID=A0A1F6GQZ1_9PROT|nr:MAG: transcriptional regulator [Candidatus Lambdaproteobacteria bacterium RIFOXYD2_FULL_56_26]OGH01396.1 MAG: transcriptional regulator [Candidatus Lambdaproteobacteria bacterium RIFOXYC1_FULL_56_13]OGH06937.1 MAG: transcriptional regulator [Candidatus Lambdaproteobacteria bacterium RIFOXYD1_FULL_56_27]